MSNYPKIGDEILDPNAIFTGLDGVDKFDQLLANGAEVDESKHPEYWGTLPKVIKSTEVQKLTASNTQAGDRFGISCSLYEGKLAVGAYTQDTAGGDAGMVYIYEYNAVTSLYEEVQKLTASNAGANDLYGRSCSLYGDKLAVGSYLEDTAGTDAGIVYIYEYNAVTSLYEEVQKLTASNAGSGDRFGVSCSLYEGKLAIGARTEDTAGTDAGIVYIYEYNAVTGLYEEVQKLTASNAGGSDNFGYSCSLYEGKLAVGAYREDTAGDDAGMVYIYEYNAVTSLYEEVQKLTAINAEAGDNFGSSCSLYSDKLAVGAHLVDTTSVNNGIVYLYKYNTTTQAYEADSTVIPDDAGVSDSFGIGCSLFEDKLSVGAQEAETGALTDQGLCYIYNIPETAYRPTMTSPDQSCPYRVTADLTRPIIGDTVDSPFNKYYADGVPTNDLLLSGGTYLISDYPILAQLYDDEFSKAYRLDMPNIGFDQSILSVCGIDDVVVICVLSAPTSGGTRGSYICTYTTDLKGVYTHESTVLISANYLTERDGTSIAINQNHLFIGVPRFGSQGKVDVYNRDTNYNYSFHSSIAAITPQANAYFGYATATSGDNLIIGAYSFNIGSDNSSGRVDALSWNGSTYVPLVEFDRGGGLFSFGQSLGIDGDSISIGAPNDGGDEGVLYSYDWNGGNPVEISAVSMVHYSNEKLGYSGGGNGGKYALYAAPWYNASNSRAVVLEKNGNEYTFKSQINTSNADSAYGAILSQAIGDLLYIGTNSAQFLDVYAAITFTLQANTSTNPNFPDKIVADLTGGA